jgi:4a-hydroxytetrahydrobiopterin dehydratase
MKNDWIEESGYLTKEFVFQDFKEAFAFMIRVAFLAEELNHHPDWENSYNRLVVRLKTHDKQKVTDLDYELAKRIDQIK